MAMNKFPLLLLTISLCIFTISLENEYIIEPITELVPKNFVFDGYNTNSFKIFHYIPSCEDKEEISKNISFQVSKSDFLVDYDKVILYLYEDLSEIKQDENSKFINYKEIYIGIYNKIKINLKCENDYYFVYSVISTETQNYQFRIGPFAFQIVILNEENKFISLSPSLSDHYSFYLKENSEFFYSHNETKYALIGFKDEGKIKIIENDNNTIYENKTKYYSSIIEFKKNNKYTIICNSTKDDSLFSVIFFDEPKFFKHDFKNGPIILYQTNYDYYYELDISDYKIGENIILLSSYSSSIFKIGYQFKSILNGKNLIYETFNRGFITIKKTRDDPSLIIYCYSGDYYYNILNLIKAEEIKSDYELTINGPKYFLLDYHLLNGMNSIGIESDIPFYLYEQTLYEYSKDYNKFYLNLFITNQNNIEFHYNKKALIYFNSKEKSLFRVKKYGHSFFYVKDGFNSPSYNEYFQLCQGEDSPKELYFYNSNYYRYPYGFKYCYFSSVFGNINTYFIKDNNIKKLSDLDFDKSEANNVDFFKGENIGYFKINCTSPATVKFSNHYNKLLSEELISGKRYYLSTQYITSKSKYTFHVNLVGQILHLKFSSFGIKNNDNVKIIFNDGNSYDLSRDPLEINYEYKEYSGKAFYFELKEDIDYIFEIEIIVGFLEEELKNDYEIKDLVDSFGEYNVTQDKKGVIIKIPKDFDAELFDISIILPNWSKIHEKNNLDIQISYDKLEFMVPMNESNTGSPVIPLFKDNPYKNISEDIDNIFFYIMIYYNIYYLDYSRTYIIKKPKLYDNVEFNKTNVLPKEDKKYYYKIKIPEDDYNSLMIKTLYSGIKLTFSINNIHYPYIIERWDKPNILFDNNNKKERFLNYYESDPNRCYINIVKDYIFYDNFFRSTIISEDKFEVNQIKGKNKIKINRTSLSYYYYPEIFQYYIIAKDLDYSVKMHSDFYSIITNQQKLEESKHEFMTFVEDDGTNEIFETEIDIDIKLKKESNEIYAVPVRKGINLIEEGLFKYTYFDYKNHKSNKKTLIIVFSIIGAILVIVALLIIYFKVYKKKKNSIEDLNEPITDGNIELN